MKIAIMAGGKGTRVASVNNEVPKPMIPLSGKPVLEHQLSCLKSQGFTSVTLIVGYKGDVITSYFADGQTFGMNIDYIYEDEPLGTAGALYYFRECDEDLLLLNGDVMFDIDINRFYTFHKEKKALATLFVHPNNHPYDSGLIATNSDCVVVRWLHKEDERLWEKNIVNAGLHFLSPSLLVKFQKLERLDLDRDVLKKLIGEGGLYAYISPEYVKDMGTPKRIDEVESDILKGIPAAKNLLQPQKAIFLDRDGTINQYVGFLKNIDDFRLIDGVSTAIRKINASGYLAIVVTNQPVIARGDITTEQLHQIHDKMETLLGNDGAYIDKIYYCPHHTDKGFPGEIAELKFDCLCRKPKAGMLLQAARELGIDLTKSVMIGDSDSDVLAGQNAGCKTIKLGADYDSVLDFVNNYFY